MTLFQKGLPQQVLHRGTASRRNAGQGDSREIKQRQGALWMMERGALASMTV